MTGRLKNFYRNRNKDICRSCREEIKKGDRVAVTFNGSTRKLDHRVCWERRAINIEK